MKKAFLKVVAVFLLAIFVVASTPDELFHLFANHHDTVDGDETTATIHVHHLHCQALEFSLTEFTETVPLCISAQFLSLGLLLPEIKTFTPLFFSLNPSERAPPLIG